MSKSITNYVNSKPCLFKKLNESDPISGVLILYTLLSSCMYVVIKLFTYILTPLSVSRSIKTAKETKEYSQKLSEILNDQVICYIVKDKSPNAFNVGGKSCYITDSLFNMCDDRERISVFLHEYGHYKNNHHIKILSFDLTFGAVSIIAFDMLLIIFFDILIPFVVPILSSFLGDFFIRKITKAHEYEADGFVAQYGYKTELMSSLSKIEDHVKKQVCKDLSKKECEEVLATMRENSTHPTLKERFKKILVIPVIQRFIFKMSVTQSDTNIFQDIKSYLKQKIFNIL